MPFPVSGELQLPEPAAFSPHLPPTPWLSFLGASQPRDATLGLRSDLTEPQSEMQLM